jgi:hypothetical protein
LTPKQSAKKTPNTERDIANAVGDKLGYAAESYKSDRPHMQSLRVQGLAKDGGLPDTTVGKPIVMIEDARGDSFALIVVKT